MAKRVLAVDEIMKTLRTTVPRLDALTEGVAPARLQASPAPDAWSVNDVLAHLRACNDVLGGAARRIVTEDHPSWRAMSPRTWQRRSGYHGWTFGRAFDAFAEGRAELLVVLVPMAENAWERTAAVTVPPGQVHERSVRYYGDWLADHERTHLRSLPAIIERIR